MFRKLKQSNILRNLSQTKTNDVLFDSINKTAIIQLNKPKTLNALTYSIIEQIYSKIKQWESNENIQLIIIKSTDRKAFSAGGDIKLLSTKSIVGKQIRTKYLKYECRLIGHLKRPYVALMNGVTMGGGCGLSVNGSFRIATEKTIFAMPETAIGAFSNAGGSYFLSHLSNNLGVYLGLTGARLHGIDVFHAGIATHFLPSNQLEEVQRKLIQLPETDFNSVKELLDKHSRADTSQSEFSLQKQLSLINRIFSIDAKNVESIFDGLKSDESSFALKQLSILQKLSPTSLKITLEALKRGKELDLKECLKMEYRILQRILNKHDFFEGVRAVLIDKDNRPRWEPQALELISDEDILHYFEYLSSNEELVL